MSASLNANPNASSGGYFGATPIGDYGFPGSGSINTPGFIPDYKSLIANDANLLQTQKDLAAQGLTDLTGRNNAFNRAIVGFGAVPDFNQAQKTLGLNLGDVLGPDTAQLAQGNEFSTQANLGHAHIQAVQNIRKALASRGLLRSGETGYQLGEENRQYGQAQYDSTQKLLDYLAGAQQAYAEAEKQRTAQTTQAREAATTRQIGLNPATGSQEAKLDAGLSAQAGEPIYVGANGKKYRADQTIYEPPAPAPARPPQTGAIPGPIQPDAQPATISAGGPLPGGIPTVKAPSMAYLESLFRNHGGR